MATKTKTFGLFGVEYRTTQFTAVRSLEIMKAESTHPLEILSRTEVHDLEHGWLPLDSQHAVNTLVKDYTEALAPRMVLHALMRTVNEFSFGFTSHWRGVKIPTRFTSGTDPRNSSYTDPLIASLIQDGVASMRELEEYYSLEDAFKMFDVMVAKGVNAAIAHEQSMKKNK